MARRPRLVAEHGTYHVTSRGNRRSRIFHDEYDYDRFLRILEETRRRHQWSCLTYCLMPNHFHLLIDSPGSSLAAGMHLLNGRYAQAFNRRYGHVGHVFQDRFGSELIATDAHLLETIRYIALNPVRGWLTRRPEEWPWSTYAELIGGPRGIVHLATAEVLGLFGSDPVLARGRLRSFVEDGRGTRRFDERVA